MIVAAPAKNDVIAAACVNIVVARQAGDFITTV